MPQPPTFGAFVSTFNVFRKNRVGVLGAPSEECHHPLDAAFDQGVTSIAVGPQRWLQETVLGPLPWNPSVSSFGPYLDSVFSPS